MSLVVKDCTSTAQIACQGHMAVDGSGELEMACTLNWEGILGKKLYYLKMRVLHVNPTGEGIGCSSQNCSAL